VCVIVPARVTVHAAICVAYIRLALSAC